MELYHPAKRMINFVTVPKYFAEFCARTYRDQIIEFDKTLFSSYMRKVMERAPEEHAKIPLKNFLRDLTDNLCIMYKEGEKNITSSTVPSRSISRRCILHHGLTLSLSKWASSLIPMVPVTMTKPLICSMT